jgi:ribosomal protein L15
MTEPMLLKISAHSVSATKKIEEAGGQILTQSIKQSRAEVKEA